MSMKKEVVIRQVWADNLQAEFDLIRQIIPHYPFAAMDTEFPGVIFHPNVDKRLYPRLHPVHNYQLMKVNVEALNIIQLGLVLSDADGNLPDFGSDVCYIWEFNFRDFDVDRDRCNMDSIELLKNQGIDFQKNKEKGIHSCHFAILFLNSGLVCNYSHVTWITFHGAYDFGFLMRILIGRELPSYIGTFMRMVRFYFGWRVYDVKYMARFCDGLYGGLEKVANTLKVERVAGKSHQAGSDSLLTLQTFIKMTNIFFTGKIKQLNMYKGFLHGLEVMY